MFEYWQDVDRAKKFTKGGTRVPAVQYLMNRAEVEIHQGVWVDTAIGAGFVQSQIFDTVEPILVIGLDVSRAMLDLVSEPTERILGSAFEIPLRHSSSNLTTNIFCLSDYPDPSKAFAEFNRITKITGVIMFLDYSTGDEYWTLRRAAHSSEVVGNINLRNPDSIVQFLPTDLRVIQNTILKVEVNNADFDNRLNLPSKLSRAFLYVELYKPRSSN